MHITHGLKKNSSRDGGILGELVHITHGLNKACLQRNGSPRRVIVHNTRAKQDNSLVIWVASER